MTALALSAFALVPGAYAQDKGTVGIVDADQVLGALDRRRRQHGQGAARSKGYKTDLQYAEDDIPNQLAQIENMITKGAKVLVIAAIDGTTLSDALQKAADTGIKVIAYDRLIRNSKNVDYYATFDNFQVGVLQAQLHRRRRSASRRARARSTSSCSAARPTTTTPSSSTTAPCRCSSPTSTAASWWCAASRWAWTRSRTLRWDGAVAQARMDNLLSRLLHRQARRRGAVAL